MLTHLSSTNECEQKMTISVAQFFARQNELPAELCPVLIQIASTDPKAEVAAAATKTLETVVRLKSSDASEIRLAVG
jgi:hypothetical protein